MDDKHSLEAKCTALRTLAEWHLERVTELTAEVHKLEAQLAPELPSPVEFQNIVKNTLEMFMEGEVAGWEDEFREAVLHQMSAWKVSGGFGYDSTTGLLTAHWAPALAADPAQAEVHYKLRISVEVVE